VSFSIAERWEPVSQTLRRLRRDWGFTTAFVVTLALGLAANAAVFSALDVYFLAPLPYPHGKTLVDVYFGAKKFPLPPGMAMSAAGWRELQSVPALSSSGLESARGNLTVEIPGETAANHEVDSLTASTLATLDVRPILGRWISPAADRVGGPAEVDIGYGLWESAFHGDRHVLGRTLRISSQLYTVVGVMPRDFAFPVRHTELWVPIVLTPAALAVNNLADFSFVMIARSSANASRAELDTELDATLARLEQSLPPAKRAAFRNLGLYTAFMPLRTWLGGEVRGRLLMMQLGAGILLLLAVASLVNLALARALRRRDEAALRVVLGAGRRLLLRQSLLESLPLAPVAVLIAWPLTELGMRALTRFGIASSDTTFDLHAGPVLWMLDLVVALVLSSAALAVPQLLLRVERPAELLHGTGKDGGGGHRVRPLRLVLSVGQIALAIALLAVAVLLGRSLRNMLDTSPGFDTRQLYTGMLMLQGPQYEHWGPWLDAHQRLAAAVAALPGVQASGIGEGVPFATGSISSSSFTPVKKRPGDAPAKSAIVTLAGPDLMKTLGVHLLAGRLLDASDTTAKSVNVVLDERYAMALFGRADVVGQDLDCSQGTCRVVGVVATIRDRFASYYSFASGAVFVPENTRTFQLWGGDSTILIRSSAPPEVIAQELRTVVHRTLPDQSLIRFLPMPEQIRNAAQGAAALASLLIAFGLLAFTLAIIGTYGVVAYVTGLRRREFAVRQAVGAEPVQIESLVLGQGLALWALGTVVGVGCALIFARSLAAQLYRVSLYSPATYAVPALVVGAAVMLASWIPARGARKLDLVAQIRPE
jgi:putative ABC transport system permease protein